MMTCQQLIDFLTDYLDGKLPLSQRVAFELHLTLCRDCRSYLHNYKAAIEASRSAFDAPAESLQEIIPEDLVSAILKARQNGPS